MGIQEKQSKLCRMIADLISFAHHHGYELTFGDAYRDPRAKFPYSSDRSLHNHRLAVDFNLFKNGKWLRTTEDFEPLGIYWESIGGSWGGRFSDGNHFSIKHDGRR